MSVCRVCLCCTPEKDIEQLGFVINEEEHNYEKIMLFCLDIQIVKDSPVTTKLCENCFKKIIEFYQFKYSALTNDAYLQSVASQPVKCEDLGDIIDEESLPYIDFHGTDSPCHDVLVKNEVIDGPVCDPAQITYEYVVEFDEVEVKEPDTKIVKKSCEKKTKSRKKPKQKDAEINSEVCFKCGKLVKNLKTHCATHFPLEKRDTYECDLCNKTFKSVRGKKKHIKNTHTPNARKQCSLCNIAVLHLKQHIKTVHKPEARTFKCVSCNKKFVSQSVLNNHLSVHTNDRPFECDQCGKSFRTKTRMMFHKRRLHNKEKSYICDICAKSFFKKETLVTHIRIHTKEKPYQCPDCNKAFISSKSLKNHQFTHTNQEFECTQCDKRFSMPKYLSTHLLTHKKEKRYPCRYCSVAFYRSDHRKRHEMTAHGKVFKAES